jgi:hypothetical protein
MSPSEFEELFRGQPRLLTPKQVATLLGMSERALRLWRAKGFGPAHRPVGKKFIKYEEAVVLSWLEQQRRLHEHARCPTCGARTFHGAQRKLRGGPDEAR